MKFSITLFFLLIVSNIYSQMGFTEYRTAKELYENGKPQECISLLQKIENQIGANPKIYSLYIKSYLEITDYTKAAIALNKFKKIVGTKSSPAISEILALEKEIIQGLEKEDQEFLKNSQQKQQKEADQIIQANILLNTNKKNEMQKSFQEYTLNKLSKSTLSDILESLPQMTPSMVEKALSNLDKNGATWLDITKELRRVKTIKSEAEIHYSQNKNPWTISRISLKNFDANNNLTRSDYQSYGVVKCENCPSIEPNKITFGSIEDLFKKQKTEYFQSQTIQNIFLSQGKFQIQKTIDEKNSYGIKNITTWTIVNDNNQVIFDSLVYRNTTSTGQTDIISNIYETEPFPIFNSTKSFFNNSLITIREKKFNRISNDLNTYSFTEFYEEPAKKFKNNTVGTITFNKMGDKIFETSKLNQYEPMKSSYKYSYDLYGNILWREWTNNQGVVFRTLYIREYHDGYIPLFHPYEKMKDFIIN